MASSDSWSSELGEGPRRSPDHSSVMEENGEEERVVERREEEGELPLLLENARLTDCFINAVVQMLRGLPLFALRLEEGMEMEEKSQTPLQQEISSELLRLLRSSGKQSVSYFQSVRFQTIFPSGEKAPNSLLSTAQQLLILEWPAGRE